MVCLGSGKFEKLFHEFLVLVLLHHHVVGSMFLNVFASPNALKAAFRTPKKIFCMKFRCKMFVEVLCCRKCFRRIMKRRAVLIHALSTIAFVIHTIMLALRYYNKVFQLILDLN